MKLHLLRAHQDDRFPEIGDVSSLFWNRDRTLFAVVSEYAPLPSAIRPRFASNYGQRVCLYAEKSRTVVACLSGASHTIFDIAFHPERPVLLLSTASYDGGFYLQGELIEWNWQKNERRLLAEGPAFYASRFSDSSEIEILVTPVDEEDISSDQDAFKTFRYGKFRAVDIPSNGIPREWLSPPYLRDVVPEEVEFNALPIFSEERKALKESSRLEAHSLLSYGKVRGVVRDVAASESGLIVIKDRPTLEYRNAVGVILNVIESDFTGSQVCPIDGKRYLVTTHAPKLPLYTTKDLRGRIEIWSQGEDHFQGFVEGANPFLLSQARGGTALARSCSLYSDDVADRFRQPMGIDYVIEGNLQTRPISPLGPYTPTFNYLATRGSERLYFLGPQARATGLQLRYVDVQSGMGEMLDVVDKRPDAEFLAKSHSFLTPELFSSYQTESGEDLIGSGALSVFPGKWLLWRHDIAGKRWTWKRLFDQRAHFILGIAQRKAVLVGLDGGILELLDAETGETLDQTTVLCAGVPSLAMEACWFDMQCVIVTLEGRLLFFKIE